MKSVHPLVTVIIPAFNVEAFLGDSVNSALDQSFTALEVIIVNDASSDATGNVALALSRNDSRVRLIESSVNLGGAGTRNLGLAEARGRFVAFLDGDDAWTASKLEGQLATMRAGNAQICYTAVQKIDEQGRLLGSMQEVPADVRYDELLGNPVIACSSVMIDYEALGRPLMPDIRKRQDFAFWLQLLRNGAKAVGINEPLTYYRVRPGSLSSNKLSAVLHTWRVYREFERLPLHKTIPAFTSYVFHAFRKRMNR